MANRKESKEMARCFGLGLLLFASMAQVACAATISAVLKPGYTDSSSNGFAGKVVESTLGGPAESFFGTVKNWSPPAYDILVNQDQPLASGKGTVRIDVSQTGTLAANNFVRYNLTSYSQLYTPGGGAAGTPTSVYNSAYWEITINGVFNWQIFDQDPQIRVPSIPDLNLNTRTFRFVKVVGGVESAPIASNLAGTGSLGPSGTNLTSGTYRLWYEHYDPKVRNLSDFPLKENSTNLDIRFDFVSEDGGSGVVPEPSSVAVFGLLSIGSAIAKWRRKK